jgi:hypothetical protein
VNVSDRVLNTVGIARKTHRVLSTVGLVCLISLAVRRPPLYEAANQLAAAHPDWAAEGRPGLDSPGSRRSLATLTEIIGVTGIADAVAQIVLALTVSTATFVVVARIASWTIIGTGVAVGALYVRSSRRRLRPTGDRELRPDGEPPSSVRGSTR